MVLLSIYNRLQDNILNENMSGTYIKARPSTCSKVILALGIMNLALCFSSLYTYYNTSVISIPYKEDIQSMVFLPKGTNYIYIDIEGVYQNHLSYIKSINYSQLRGKIENLNLKSTTPFDYNNDLPYYPAGAIAATYFQDQINIDGLDIQKDSIIKNADKNMIGTTAYLPDTISIPINWENSTNQGTEPLNTFENSGLPILNEQFVSWIMLSPFSNFKKLWGRLNVPEAGEYNITVLSNYNIAKKKSILITEKSSLGIPNYYATVGFFAVAVLSILSSVYLKTAGY
ncbi:Cell cycle control protein 50A [Glugoides intestinalis]